MISEEEPLSKTSRNKAQPMQEESLIPNIKFKSNTFNTVKNNFGQNNQNSIDQPQAESYRDKTFYNGSMQKTNNTKDHPLLSYYKSKLSDSLKEKYNHFPLYTEYGLNSVPNDIVKRNIYSINTRYFDHLKKKKEFSLPKKKDKDEQNDNFSSIKIYKSYNQKYNIPDCCINMETYNLTKKKMYARDRYSNIKTGLNISKKEFIEQKKKLLHRDLSKSLDCKKRHIKELENSLEDTNVNKVNLYKTINTENGNNKFIFKDPNDYTIEVLKGKNFKFDRNNKIFLKHRNWWNVEKNSLTKTSKDAPDWFNVVPSWKAEQFKKYLENNEDTINIISKHQNWITISPRSMDRKHPLEKMKAENMEVTSKIMPKWMEIKHKKSKRLENFKVAEYFPLKQKAKKLIVFVDKDLNPSKLKPLDYDPKRSIFSFGDFRHNIMTKNEKDIYDAKVSQEPKRFFNWDDGKKFVPKYKKDV